MTDKGKKVISKVLKDKKTMKALEVCKTKADIVRILNANGYECSIEDFKEEETKNRKVSLDEAKAISGGTTCACVVGGGGGEGLTGEGCGCVFVGGGGPADDPDTCFCALGGGSSW